MNSSLPQSQAVCRICYHPLHAGEAATSCPDCGSLSHRECWEEIGGCATYGCPQMVETKKTREQVNFWGATEKRCPMCAEMIPMKAMQCPYCKLKFDDYRPLTAEDLARPSDDESRSVQRKATRLLMFSALGITSPITLIVALRWYMRGKDEIARGGATTSALVLVSMLISLVYLIVLPLGWLAFRFAGNS